MKTPPLVLGALFVGWEARKKGLGRNLQVEREEGSLLSAFGRTSQRRPGSFSIHILGLCSPWSVAQQAGGGSSSQKPCGRPSCVAISPAGQPEASGVPASDLRHTAGECSRTDSSGLPYPPAAALRAADPGSERAGKTRPPDVELLRRQSLGKRGVQLPLPAGDSRQGHVAA